jgi:hypothetical protein
MINEKCFVMGSFSRKARKEQSDEFELLLMFTVSG